MRAQVGSQGLQGGADTLLATDNCNGYADGITMSAIEGGVGRNRAVAAKTSYENCWKSR